MKSLLSKVRGSVSTIVWQVLLLTMIAVALIALSVCVYFIGSWNTFVGAMLIVILFKLDDLHNKFAKVDELRNELLELKLDIKLAQDLAKGPPHLRTIPANELQSGMYLCGSELIGGVNALDSGKIMAHPDSEEADSPYFFDPEELVEVTDRSLLIYEGGSELASASRLKRFSSILKSGIVLPGEAT